MADPMYRQIADDLRRQVESGDLQPGSQLPTELELREKYDASRNTVRDAIKTLTTRGLVETRPGQGTFVTTRIQPFVNLIGTGPDGEGTAFLAQVEAQNRFPAISQPRVELQAASDAVAAELRLAPGSQVVIRTLQRFIDGVPWSLQASFCPMSFVEQGATELISAAQIVSGPAVYLHEALGLQEASWSDKLTVRPPDDSEARFFAIPDDGRVPVIDIWQTAYDREGVPFLATLTTYPADRNTFRRLAGVVPSDVLGL